MLVHFVKTSHSHYTLECHRADGSTTSRTLEARSFLIHDLVHFALERDAGFHASFFGGIAAGRNLGDDAPFSGELAVTELIVGPVQSAVKSGARGDDLVAGIRDYAAAQSALVPAVVTGALIDGVVAWVRTSVRRFDGLRTGERLIVTFDLPQPPECLVNP